MLNQAKKLEKTNAEQAIIFSLLPVCCKKYDQNSQGIAFCY
jgi:hypothetical protein